MSEALSPAPAQVKQVPNSAALDQPATVAFIRPLYSLMKTLCFHHPHHKYDTSARARVQTRSSDINLPIRPRGSLKTTFQKHTRRRAA